MPNSLEEKKLLTKSKSTKPRRLRRGEVARIAPGTVPTRGPLPQSEKDLLNEIVDSRHGVLNASEIAAVSVLVRKNPATVIEHVRQAREKLQQRALEYVELHANAGKRALEIDEVGEARKAAEWALEHISATDGEGKTERVIERAAAASTAPQIRIGISLGGMPNTTRELPPQTIDAKVITRDDA